MRATKVAMFAGRGLLSILALIGLMSCSGDTYSLLNGDADPWAGREARMAITVLDNSEGSIRTEIGVGALEDAVVLECVAMRPPNGPAARAGCNALTELQPLDQCGQTTCRANLALCVAHRMRELAELVVAQDVGTYTVIPQDMASRAALNERALYRAQYALTMAGENLRAGTYVVGSSEVAYSADPDLARCTPKTIDDDPGGGLTFGESLAFDLAEATHLVQDAGAAAMEANIAVADSEFSITPSRGEASRNAWTAPVLSRYRAAMLLLGAPSKAPAAPSPTPPPDPESPAYYDWAFVTGGFAPSSPPDTSALGFVDLLRQAGLNPRDVMDVEGTSFEELYLGTGGVETGLRAALAELTGLPELTGATPLDADEFLELYGFGETDVLVARTYMREEMVALGRDPAALMPSYLLGADAAGDPIYYSHPRYVATSLPPTGTPESYYMRLARLHVDGEDQREDGAYPDAVRPAVEYAMSGIGPAIDYALTTTYTVLPNPSLGAGTEALGEVTSAEWENRLARVELCYGYKTDPEHHLTLSVYVDAPVASAPETQFLLVRGTAGAACATRGNIDGAPCELADYLPTEPALRLDSRTSEAVSDPSFGFPTRVVFSFKNVDPSQVVDLHLVRSRDGLPDGGAGSYELYGPVHFAAFTSSPVSSPEPILCNAYAVLFDLNKNIYTTLAPEPTAPDEPIATCGDLVETRIPLENELIEDGDAFESSWRHHLSVARAAADEADRLGEELIESGLAIDTRADAANEALLRACGVTVNLDGLFGASAGTTVMPGACPVGPSGEPEGLNVGGSCVRLALENIHVEGETDRDARALAECLGSDDDIVVPLASLGSTPLCVWRRVADAGVVCDGATGSNRCPWDPEDVGGVPTCAPRWPTAGMASDYEPVLVDLNLGLFEAPAEETGGISPSAPDCTDVQNLRREDLVASVRSARLLALRRSNFFWPANVVHWASRLGWEGRPDDFSVLTIDGTPWLETGDVFDDAPTSEYWPCTRALPGLPDLPAWGGVAGDALFPTQVDCSVRAERVAMNRRMGRGMLALALLSGVGPINSLLPVVYRGVPGPSDFDGITPHETSYRNDWLGRQWEVATQGTIWSETTRRSGLFYRPIVGGTTWTLPYGSVPSSTWVGFVRFGSLGAPPEGLVREIWEDMSMSTTSIGYARPERAYGSLVRNAVDRWFAPDYPVLRGVEWLRRDDCGAGGTCDPNVRRLTEYWQSVASRVRTRDGGFSTDDVGTNRARLDAYDDPDGVVDLYYDSALTVRDVLDGLEIMCEASRAVRSGDVGSCVDTPPDITSREDLPRMRQYLLCAANEIETQGEHAVVQNIPERILRDFVDEGSAGLARSDTGEIGEASLAVRSALTELSEVHRAIASVIRDVETELQVVELQLANLGSSREILDLETMSNALDRVTACASSNSINGAVATCANAAAQIAISIRLRDLNREMLARNEMQLLIEAIDRIQDHGDRLSGTAAQISLLLDRLNTGLSRYEAGRASARRALANAALLGSDPDGRSVPMNTALGARYDIRVARYDEARRSAVRLAHIARRSLEQRLGTDLADLGPLSLVEDPAGWVNLLCESSGIDYSRLRDETGLPYETESFMYIGDYVRRLELVFESYRFDFPFTSATDTAVVSMRDEIRARRTDCDVETYNLLASSADPRSEPWATDGCVAVDDGTGTVRVVNCVAALPVDPEGVDRFVEVPMDGVAGAFRVVFGSGATGAPSDPDVSFTPSTRLYQDLVLATGGRYLLSWYGRQPEGLRNPKSAVVVVGPSGEMFPQSASFAAPIDGTEWSRHFMFYELPAGTPLRVEIRPQGPFATVLEEAVDLAALQLEDVNGLFDTPLSMITWDHVLDGTGRYLPRPFVGTGSSGLVRRRVCEDAGGARFREGWVPGCTRVCSGGLDRGCTDEDRVVRCYRETEFAISADELERGGVLGLSGFAYGNFNYRIESLALNFVGTGSRTCEDAAYPSSCYSSGYIPYSLYHYGADGGYEVRNHAGAIYHANLFTGRIETADGLAAERYVTNPISSADRALVDPYLRRDFVGRPVPGRYVLRVWEDPGVNFEGIEDIQIVLNYRYWTRLD